RTVVPVSPELVVRAEPQAIGIPLFQPERHRPEIRVSGIGRIENRRLERRIWHPRLDRRRSGAPLIDVETLVLVAALAACVRDFEQIVVAETALNVDVPLHDV